MCASHARICQARFAAHAARCREESLCVRCGNPLEPWRRANACTACTQALGDVRRAKGQYKTKRTVTCMRCGRSGHHHNSCTIPPFSWEGPISDSLEQLHAPLDEKVRDQKKDDLATYLAHIKRLEWELAHNSVIVIRRRDG